MLTIGIVLYNEEKQLQCVEQNIALFARHEVNVILVDNASTDQTAKRVGDLVERYKVKAIYRSENHMAAARSSVMSATDSEWVGFIDADCRIDEQWVKVALRRCSENLRYSALGGPLFPGGAKHQMYQRLFKSFLGNINSAQVKSFSVACGVKHLPTANVLYRRQDVLEAGNFDLKKSRVGEDLDMSYRLQSRGKHLFMDPDLALVHQLPDNFFVWIKKVFNYGRARGEVAVEHGVLWTYPFLMPLLFFVFLICHVIFLAQGQELFFFTCFFIYLAAVMAHALYYGRHWTAQLFLNFIAMHVAYSSGLFIGLFKNLQPVRRSSY